jgi:hypothetical protein
MRRRDIIKATAAGGMLAIVGASSEAQAKVAGVNLNFDFFWDKVLSQRSRDTITAILEKATDAVGRVFGINTQSTVSVGGNTVSIGVTVRRRQSDGHLIVSSHVTHAGQKVDTASHYGTAQDHQHPHMHAHCKSIVGKVHTYLVSRGA